MPRRFSNRIDLRLRADLAARATTMAKLSELKTLIERERAAKGASAAPARAPAVNVNGASTSKSVARRLASTKHADGDIDLASAFADVERLPASNKVRVQVQPPAPIARQREADERDALEASKFGVEPSPHTWDIGQEIEGEQTFLRDGLGQDVLTRLRRGRWSVQAELDLHGMIAVDARDALADFLIEARSRGLRCVRIIHGKGLTSPNREPVLKGRVRKWLAQWDDVLAYCEAPRHAGGSGAVLALLRGRRNS
jgi:DNA-nicking Smr family endonuclease